MHAPMVPDSEMSYWRLRVPSPHSVGTWVAEAVWASYFDSKPVPPGHTPEYKSLCLDSRGVPGQSAAKNPTPCLPLLSASAMSLA